MNKFLLLFFISFFLTSCSPTINDLSNNDNQVSIVFDQIGEGQIIKNHYKVTVHYKGEFENGEVFDSSYKRNKPFEFQYGLRQVIEGWEIGLKGIKVGGKRKIKIPPNLAYGTKGIKKLIPPNSTLIFEIEILDIKPHNYYIINSDILLKFKNENFIDKKNNKLFLIDIRTSKDYLNTGYIKNSINIEAFDEIGNLNSNFLKKYRSLVKENDHVVLIDSDGEISSILANGLVENIGLKNIYSLKGGINEWIIKGNSIIK